MTADRYKLEKLALLRSSADSTGTHDRKSSKILPTHTAFQPTFPNLYRFSPTFPMFFQREISLLVVFINKHSIYKLDTNFYQLSPIFTEFFQDIGKATFPNPSMNWGRFKLPHLTHLLVQKHISNAYIVWIAGYIFSRKFPRQKIKPQLLRDSLDISPHNMKRNCVRLKPLTSANKAPNYHSVGRASSANWTTNLCIKHRATTLPQ